MSYQHYLETPAIEIRRRFLDFDQREQGLLIGTAGEFLKVTNLDVLHRIYSISNPLCVIGYSQDEAPKYCRVEDAEENKPFKICLAQYLPEASPKRKGGTCGHE